MSKSEISNDLELKNSSECSNSNVMMGLQRKLNCFLEKFSTQCRIKTSFKREDGSAKRGDYSIYFHEVFSKTENPEKIIQNLQSELGDDVEKCYNDSFSRIIIRLNRYSVYLSTLRQVLTFKDKYGASFEGKNATILIMPEFNDISSLSNLRTLLLSQHAALVLVFNGYKVYLSKNASAFSDISKKNLILYNCAADCDFDGMAQAKLQQAHNSNWKVDLKNIKLEAIDKGISSNDLLILDGRQYLTKNAEKSLKRYDKNIGHLYVKKGNLTDCFNKSIFMRHVLTNHVNDNISTILHIVPENKACIIQQSGLLSEMLNDPSPEHHYFIHKRTMCKNNYEIDKDGYFNVQYKAIQNSLVHKYGPDIENDKTWKSCIDDLTRTVVTFDFLSNRHLLSLKIDASATKGETNEKGGAFVQYNCARLSMLFKHFEDRVQNGQYQSLPNLEDIDFTLLKQDEEWHLFYNYVLSFPCIVREFIKGSSSSEPTFSDIQTHTIPQMLMKLSRDLSIYYNKTRILIDPYPQLQERMFARLYLLQSVHQVMKCALALLNLPAVDKM